MAGLSGYGIRAAFLMMGYVAFSFGHPFGACALVAVSLSIVVRE